MLKKIRKWEPDDFELEMTTHWSFPKRADGNAHDAKWRENCLHTYKKYYINVISQKEG